MLRVWSELLPYDELRAPRALALLRRHPVRTLVACWPLTLEAALDAVSALRDAGLDAGLWPMLDDARGRWCNTDNLSPFLSFAERVCERSLARREPARELAVDLEPALERMQRWLSGARELFSRQGRAWFAPRFDGPSATANPHESVPLAEAERRLTAFVRAAQREGTAVSAALVPFVLLDRRGSEHGLAGWLGTPWERVPWDHVSVMAYASLAEGWSRGLCTRAMARRLVGLCARAVRARVGERGGVSLGLLGTGALGDEPLYPGLEPLLEDTRACVREGVRDVSLYDLRGLLRQSDPERHLDAWAAASLA